MAKSFVTTSEEGSISTLKFDHIYMKDFTCHNFEDKTDQIG